MPALDAYLEQYLRIPSKKWYEFIYNLEKTNAKSEFLLGYQNHLRTLSTFKLLKLMRRCTEIDLRCNLNGQDFIRAGLTELTRRLRCPDSSNIQVGLLRDLSHILKLTRFCQADESKVSVCIHNECNNCSKLYKELLEYSAPQLIYTLVRLIGHNIIKNANMIKSQKGSKCLSESAIIPYCSILGSLNIEYQYLLRQILILYNKCITNSKSLICISAVLQVISKIGGRLGLFRNKLIRQLSYNNIINLLNLEKSDKTKQISIGQLLCVSLYLKDTRIGGLTNILAKDLIKIIKDTWQVESLCSSLKSQIALYHSYIDKSNQSHSKIINENRSIFEAIKKDFERGNSRSKKHLTYKDPEVAGWKTTVFQQQVSNLLDEMGYSIDCEVPIYPYIVDILVDNEFIIEVNGPYHYMYQHRSEGPRNFNKNTLLKEKILVKRGFKVLNLAYDEWPADKDLQVEKLSKMLSVL